MTMLLSKESNSFQLQYDSETELGKQLWIRDLSLPSLPVTFNESLNFSWPWFYEMENWDKIYTWVFLKNN